MVFAAKQPTTTSREDDLFLMLMSASAESTPFTLPKAKLHGHWRLVFDTARPDEADWDGIYVGGKDFPLLPRSFVLLHDI
jgi:pullulanase/glycogen debranching enzyme